MFVQQWEAERHHFPHPNFLLIFCEIEARVEIVFSFRFFHLRSSQCVRKPKQPSWGSDKGSKVATEKGKYVLWHTRRRCLSLTATSLLLCLPHWLLTLAFTVLPPVLHLSPSVGKLLEMSTEEQEKHKLTLKRQYGDTWQQVHRKLNNHSKLYSGWYPGRSSTVCESLVTHQHHR